MKLIEVGVRKNSQSIRLVGVVQLDNSKDAVEIYFQYPARYESFVFESADAFVPLLLVPCLVTGEALTIVPPISPQLHYSLSAVQAVFTTWYRHFHHVKIDATVRTEERMGKPAGVSTFFSGGVDSFYSLLKSIKIPAPHIPQVSHLIHFHGLESMVEDGEDPATEVRVEIAKIAQEFGVDYIAGEANFRSIFPLTWGPYYFGAGLSGIALSLSAGIGHALIPSSHSLHDLFPCGSHPILDPLWSTERTAVIHDGIEVTRAEKIASLVGRDPVALRYLRVCTQNMGTNWNCGRCSKCLRTMIALRAIGTLNQASTLPHELPSDYEQILRETIYRINDFSFVKENLELCRQVGGDPQMTAVLERVVREGDRRQSLLPLVRLIEKSPFALGLRGFRTVRRLFR